MLHALPRSNGKARVDRRPDHAARVARARGHVGWMHAAYRAARCVLRERGRLADLLPADRAAKLSLFGLLPSVDDARRALADAVGLDRNAVSDDAIARLAETFHELAIAKLSRALEGVIATAPQQARGRAVCFGLGARALGKPALERAGVTEIVLAEDTMPADLAEVASCYGAFVTAQELAAERARAR